MRIYVKKKGGCSVYGSISELQSIASAVGKFIDEDQSSIRIEADDTGSPEPFVELLKFIEFVKGSGPLFVTIQSKKLRVEGAQKHLATYASHFLFGSSASSGSHHHPEEDYSPEYIRPDSVPVVVEIA
jgi:hypothetical protein